MLLIIIVILGLSVGYSALNTNLSISGDAVVRVDTDIRITDVKLLETSNGGTEMYNPNYSKDTTNMFVKLPSNSKVIYEVTIENSSSDNYVLNNISNLSNVNYELENIKVGDIIKNNSTIKFNVVISSDISLEEVNLNLKYEFKKIETTYVFNYSGQIDEFVVPANGIYKLECWGAQGGNVPDTYSENHIGGYGGYSVGTVSLNKNDELYIVVGGSGEASLTSSAGARAKGGYNGGGYSYIQGSSGTLFAAGGGGATHIATSTGLLKDLVNNKEDILIVAGGGAGAYGYGTSTQWWNGNSGGGYKGGYSFYEANAATQNSGYAFGQAGNTADNYATNYNRSGGGGGYYGGYHSWGERGAGGGSGYIASSLLQSYLDIKKSMYCYNCDESMAENIFTVSTTNISEEPISSFAKIGNGYAKITLIIT